MKGRTPFLHGAGLAGRRAYGKEEWTGENGEIIGEMTNGRRFAARELKSCFVHKGDNAMADDHSSHKIGRRDFLGTAAAAAGFMIVKPALVRGTAANSALQLGVLGCGGRGRAVATGFIDNTGTRVVALADLFADQLETAHKYFDDHQKAKGYAPLDASQLFQGPKAYEQIVTSKDVDAVLITTPPYFHPGHLEAVVAGGKHVYCEKPVAIDVPGAKRVIEIGKKSQGKLSLAVGFQIRQAPPYIELVRRIQNGALGRIGCGLAYYYCPHIDRPDWPNASPDEKRLRNWVWDRSLSGDIIVEQNVHVIDICNWALQGHPAKAAGASSRKLRADAGDCSDNFNVVFTYPNDVQISFGSTQFDKVEFDAGVRFYGSRGSCEAHYDQRMHISGEEPWDAGLGAAQQGAQFSAAGTFRGALDQADSEKQKAFVQSIQSRNFLDGAAPGRGSAA
ncbi:MAG: Gfo/Idh/MocA family oxidoreductase, partial [Acidobacteriia bacterium]|nr:Gfo/Idh/MocA family oxidoreductase [Terriglobia bacterium]